jgi:hypothetical protein
VIDAADVIDRRRHFLPSEIRTAKPDAGISRRGLERKRDLLA